MNRRGGDEPIARFHYKRYDMRGFRDADSGQVWDAGW